VINTQKVTVIKKVFELCIAGRGLTRIERLMRDTPPITARAAHRKQKFCWNTF
jgi:hypothetical protein